MLVLALLACAYAAPAEGGETASAAAKPGAAHARADHQRALQRRVIRRRRAARRARERLARRPLRGTGVPAPFPSRLRTASGEIVDGTGEPVVLRGFNMIPIWHEQPGTTWGAEHYRAIAARGFNVVRFVMYWSVLEPARGRFDARHLATLDLAVARAREAGLYVVFDPIHLYQDQSLIPPWARAEDAVTAVRRNAGGLIRTLGARYSDEDAVAAYDLVNEPPTYPPDQNKILRMYGSLTRALRSADPTRMVVVEPSYGTSSMAAADLGLLRSIGNVVFSLHDYYLGGAGDGYQPNGELSASWNSGGHHTSMDSSDYHGRHADEFERHVLHNLRIMRAARIPVWVGEFGIHPEGHDADRWIREKLAIYRRHGLGYAWWLYDAKGDFPVLDRAYRFRPFVALL